MRDDLGVVDRAKHAGDQAGAERERQGGIEANAEAPSSAQLATGAAHVQAGGRSLAIRGPQLRLRGEWRTFGPLSSGAEYAIDGGAPDAETLGDCGGPELLILMKPTQLVSNSAKTPSMSRNALPAAVGVSIGCSVVRRATPLAWSMRTTS